MDARFSQYQQQNTRPSYPQTSSPQSVHSTFQSSTSLSSLTSVSTSPNQTNMHSRQSPILRSAPLPSPRAQREVAGSNYFGAPIAASSMQQNAQLFGQSFGQQSSSIPQQPQLQQQQQHQNQRASTKSINETAPYLQGFNLVAEAAKRAEMAVLMRDLNDFEM